MSVKTIRRQARNLSIEILAEKAEESQEGYDFRDPTIKSEILSRLMLALEGGDTLEMALGEIIDAAVRDADRTMTSADPSRSTTCLLGQGVLFDFDPDRDLVCGERRRIKAKYAIVEDVEAFQKVRQRNIIGQNAAFALDFEWTQAAIEELRNLPAGTRLGDIVVEPPTGLE